MSIQVKRLLKRIISWSGIVFFVIAAGMLYWQLSKYSLSDILHSILDIPVKNLFFAFVACGLAYLTLSVYDYIALKYVGKMVVWWKWMLAGMLGFAISNNAGHAVVSGGAIRYRLYTRWRIKAGDIVKMVTFSGFTYFLGCAATLVAAYFLAPSGALGGQAVAGFGLDMLMLFCAASLAVYYGLAWFYRRTIRVFKLNFKVPSISLAIKQTIIGMTDSVFQALVLYSLLSAFVNVPFMTFISVFVIAQVVGVFSQVPGGIGVFEAVFMLVMPEFGENGNGAALFASLIAFRIIYYLIPLIGIGGMFILYEHSLRQRMKRWIEEAKHSKLAHAVSGGVHAAQVGVHAAAHAASHAAHAAAHKIHDITHHKKQS